ELVARNDRLIQQQTDVGATIFATPGSTNPQSDRPASPTLILHLNPLDHQQIRHRREHGQPLIVTGIQQPSEYCWPRSIKVRSRIHYYLADIEANKHADDAIGVLVDDDDGITETSIANLAIVESGKILSPPPDSVLGGITQRVVESLAAELQIDWTKQRISRDQLRLADEILLLGTDGGIWFANSVNGDPIAGGNPGQVCRALRNRFDQATSDP
ncbi:unnamed protein product, partial [marine sediment metagenome]